VSPPSRPRSQAGSVQPPNALFRELLRAARELLAVRSPLDAELMVSELLGTWWGQRHRSAGGAGVEQMVGEGLVEYAAGQRSPAALALLSGIACLGTPRQAVAAEQAAIELMDSGVKAPAWADHLGAVAPAECYVNPDEWGDKDEIICVFSYAGEEPHALVCLVDYNAGGMIKDGWVTSRVDKLLEHCRQASAAAAAQAAAADKQAGSAGPAGTAAAADAASPAGADQPAGADRPAGDGPATENGSRADDGFRQIEPSYARRVLKAALDTTDAAQDPPVSDSFASYHAFIRARVRTLPPAGGRTLRVRRPWSRERRALLAAEFLASDEAEDLSDRQSASRCTDRIIDFGCDQDNGRPLRMSPLKVQNFLLSWLPRRVMLSSADQDAMPHTLAAWVRWAGHTRGLRETAIGQTLETVFDSMSTFSSIYRDPAEFGLDEKLVARLLPDSDLEALPRRAFAFPVLEGKHGGVDLSRLDPANPADRRLLLAADHDTKTGSPSAAGVGRHIDRHLAIADRLWRGSPPALWDAAQRMLDAGEDRHLVLHALMDVQEAAGGDEAAFEAALRELATGLGTDEGEQEP
jgi:hypothetical protein